MLQTILAPNPSPLTGPGTNSFLIGRDSIAVIDPGPDIAAHRRAILDAASGGRIEHILVTHAHLDHSAGARALAAETGAPVLAFGGCETGRSALMQRLARSGTAGGGEGADRDFVPDRRIADGDVVETDAGALVAVHTPGHMGGHLAFLWGDRLFCGDVVLGWSSTLISPPDGDLIAYFETLERIEDLAPASLHPAHGDPVETPAARVAELRRHRQDRTAQIVRTLRKGPSDAGTLARVLYDVPAALLPAATRNVLAHLIALTQLGAVRPEQTLDSDARFELA